MSPTSFTASSAQLLRLILYSLGWLFLIDVLVSIFLAQCYLYWYSDVKWDPVMCQERKETPELYVTTSLWMYASWRTYLKLYVGESAAIHPYLSSCDYKLTDDLIQIFP